ncbi:MAG: 6,7-dimethyl-8-ribityllumazine synthase [Alphaproteobacteria bacterium]
MYDKRAPISFQFEQKPHLLIVQSSYYEDVADHLRQGALNILDRAGVTHEIVDVPGALEIPTAITYAVKSLDFDAVRRRFDGYVALGCVLKGETNHHEIVGHESARALLEISMRYALAVGNGILTCDTREQALKRADQNSYDRGGAAAESCLRMIELKQLFRLSSKRRWVAR